MLWWRLLACDGSAEPARLDPPAPDPTVPASETGTPPPSDTAPLPETCGPAPVRDLCRDELDNDGDGAIDCAITGRVERMLAENPLSATSLLTPVIRAVGDVDGDGRTDMVAQFGADLLDASLVRVYRGPFALAPPIAEISSADPSWIAPAAGRDWDGDGRADLVIASAPYAGLGARTLRFLPGSVEGAVDLATAATTLITGPDHGGPLDAFPIGDLDGDGSEDLALSWAPTPTTRRIGIVYGPIPAGETDPDALSSAWIDPPLSTPGAPIEVGDLDGDGRDDLAIRIGDAQGDRDEIQLYYAPPTGALGPPDAIVDPGEDTFVLALDGGADLTGDGCPDLAIATRLGPFPLDLSDGIRIRILAGPLSGTVDAESDAWATYHGISEVLEGTFALGDVNGDGQADLVLSVREPDTRGVRIDHAPTPGDHDVALIFDRIEIPDAIAFQVGDYDGDDIDDVAFLRYELSTPPVRASFGYAPGGPDRYIR